MKAFKEEIAAQLHSALKKFAAEKGLDADIAEDQIAIETPPKPELGDLAFPMFPFARILRMGPPMIATELARILSDAGVQASAAGPYVNVKFDRAKLAGATVSLMLEQGEAYGRGDSLNGEKIMIEFSSPNTNKPLHLGHLRNNALGESVARILAANGADVKKVNLVNDRGVHICRSMLAYQEQGGGVTPESLGRKSDHFVGDFYIKYNEMASADPSVEQRAQAMLAKWEEGDPKTIELWEKMNRWALDGIGETYRRTGIHFDEVYYEHQTYKLGKENVLAGLDKGVFYRDEEGTVWIDLEDIKLDKKVLLRKDGTSVYMTQDIGTAINRHQDWPFNRLIYVVMSEQNYHFRVLFHVLQRLGYDWAEKLYHLSYGMVSLPDGRMKSREGTVVDADNLLDELHAGALQEIREKGRDAELEDAESTAEAIALAAVHYYLLQVNPVKDMTFNPAESLSFNGNTGPYLQYVGARISSMFRKFEGELPESSSVSWGLLTEPEEWDVVKLLARYPEVIEAAGANYDPSEVATYLYDLGKAFSRFYHDHPVLNCPDPALRDARLYLAWGVRSVLRSGFDLINIPFLDVM
jgi:arginyl-tRNA synthetase